MRLGNPSCYPRCQSKGVEKCNSESYKSTNLSSPMEITTLLLNVQLSFITVDADAGNKVPLCCSHYSHLWSILRNL